MRKKPICFLDIETTGLDSVRHEIIEVSVIKEHPTGALEYYSAKIRPTRIEDADETALKINRFHSRDWSDAFDGLYVAEELSKFLHGCSVCAHNVRFDMEFLEEFFHQYSMPCRVDSRFLDTIMLAHEHLLVCGLTSLSLDSIRSFLGWSLARNHTADKDAADVRRLYHTLSRANFMRRFWWRMKNRIRQKLRNLTKK